MYSLSKLKQITLIEAASLKSSEAIGYFKSQSGKTLRRKFTFRIKEDGHPEISKPISINRDEYEEILYRLGDGRGRTFNEIKEMYIIRENDTPMSA